MNFSFVAMVVIVYAGMYGTQLLAIYTKVPGILEKNVLLLFT